MKAQLLVILVLAAVPAEEPLPQSSALELVGTVSDVVVYRGQAQVTRTIQLDLPKGSSEIVVEKLPKRIIPDSLYAQASDGITVSSVRYREQTAKLDIREQMEQLEEQIDKVKRDIARIDKKIAHGQAMVARYEPFWRLTVDMADRDLDKSLLQAEPIEKLTQYLESRLNQIHEEGLQLDDQKADLEKQLQELQHQQAELKAKRSRIEREATIFVNNDNAGKAVIRLSYLVDGANWIPHYNLRANPDQEAVVIEYNAIINQSSGEGWDNVAVTLSTAQPAMVAAPPTLDPMKVEAGSGPAPAMSYVEAMVPPGQVSVDVQQQQIAPRSLGEQLKQIQSQRRVMKGKGIEATQALNTAAWQDQMMELQAQKDAVQTIQAERRKLARSEGVSVTYTLPGRMTMPSRDERQLVTIKTFQTKADFFMVATPLLTDYVYLQAELVNDSDTILLAGLADMYRTGAFVGKGGVGLITIGEKFTVGFGVDSQVQIVREFEDKKIDTLWGNRVEKYHYRLAVNNYKDRKMRLCLLERIPYTEDEKLKIEDFETNLPLSTDAEYLRTQRKKGVLRWDIDLQPNTIGEKATVVTYSYTIKYDKDRHVRPVPTRR